MKWTSIVSNELGTKSTPITFYSARNASANLIGFTEASKLYSINFTCKISQILSITNNKDENIKYEPFPKFKNFELKLTLLENARPQIRNSWYIPAKFLSAYYAKINQWLGQKIIEKCPQHVTLEWAHPVVVVKNKKTGEPRVCIDYRLINQFIKKPDYRMITIAELLQWIMDRKAKYYSTIDLPQAYLLVELEKATRLLLAFVGPDGYYIPNRMGFGLIIASAVFTHLIRKIIGNIQGVENYIDDIIVTGDTLEECKERTEAVINKLKENNICPKNNPDTICKTSLPFIGYVIHQNSYEIPESRKQAIVNWTKPYDVQGLRSFLGTIGFCENFIPNLFNITAPLWEMLKSGQTKIIDGKPTLISKKRDKSKITWTTEAENAFINCKNAILDTANCFHFDHNWLSYIVSDASGIAIAAILFQVHPETGETRLIECFSRLLNKAQQTYDQYQRELLALERGLNHFDKWIRHEKVTIITDLKMTVKILQRAADLKPISARDANIAEKIKEYNYEIKFIAGKLNIADSLSRLLDTNQTQTLPDDIKINIHASHEPNTKAYCALVEENDFSNNIESISWLMIANYSMKDEKIQAVKNYILNDVEPSESIMLEFELNEAKSEYEWNRNTLKRNNVIVMPQGLHHLAIALTHQTHRPFKSLFKYMNQFVWWPSMKIDLKNTTDGCETCAKLRSFSLRTSLAQIFFGIGLIRTPRRNFARFIFMAFTLYCLVIRNAYQGKMFEFLHSNAEKSTPKTIKELIDTQTPIIIYKTTTKFHGYILRFQMKISPEETFVFQI